MGLRIRVRGARAPQPSELPPPGERRGTALLRAPRPQGGRLRVYVERGALAAMERRAVEAGEFEVGGFLLGGYHHYEGVRYVEIVTQVPALKAESARAHLTFSNEALREFNEVVEREHPGQVVLGWYHTHPGYGVFLSGYDQFIQRGFYGDPHHVAVVIDPTRGPETGVFVWDDGELADAPQELAVYERRA